MVPAKQGRQGQHVPRGDGRNRHSGERAPWAKLSSHPAYIAPEVTRSTAANTAAKSPSMSTSRGRRTQRAVSAVQPDLDALIVVDLARQLDHVVQIEQAVSSRTLRTMPPGGPVLHAGCTATTWANSSVVTPRRTRATRCW